MFSPRPNMLGLIAATLLLALPLPSVSGQPKALGATFSFTGFSVSYEHALKDYDSFVEISAKAETAETLLHRTDVPGFSASFTWNFPVHEWLSVNGHRLTFFAGPGIVCGFGRDFRVSDGIFAGLKGRAGIECSFERHIVLSAFISPVIGSHMELSDELLRMRYYRNGLIYSLTPEIGIKYRF